MLRSLFNDESGFVISAELVLIATLVVIGLIVGLSEVQHSVVAELNDVADAIGEINQSYSYSGFHKVDYCQTVHAVTYGSDFLDLADDCDRNQCDLACDAPMDEMPKGAYGEYGGYQGSVLVTGQGSVSSGGGTIISGQATSVHGTHINQDAAAGGTVIINQDRAPQSGPVLTESPAPTPCEGQGTTVPCEGTTVAPPCIIETPVVPAPPEGQNCPPAAPATPRH